jgi:protease I
LEHPAGRLHLEPAAGRPANSGADLQHGARRLDADARRRALRLQHLGDFAGGTVAEQLPEGLLVVGDAVALHQGDEVARRVSGERGFGKVWIARHEVLRRGGPVGEIAAPAAGDQDLARNPRVVLQHHNAPPALARLHGAHQPGGARSDDNSVHRFSRHPLTFWQSDALCWLRMTRKVLIVTGDGGDSYEALYACQRFLEAHWEPVIAAPARRRLHMVFHDTEPGWDTYMERPGHSVDANIAITAVSTKEFAAIVILGGRAPEYLRNDASLLELLREFAAQNKCICAIGHGIQVLVAAGLTSGRTVTGHPHVCVEVERAGGIYSEKLAVRDGRMITAQSWKAHPEFYREVFAVLEAPK